MSLTKVAQLALLAGVTVWIIGVRPTTAPEPTVDPVITGSIGAARQAPRGIVVAQGTQPQMQPAPNAQPAAAATPPDQTQPGSASEKVDESALRYFARQGDTRRLNAEIARLKALYPGWQPPEDPTAPEVFADPELDRMWQLFSEGRYADVRSAIAERQAKEPGWVPPGSLVQLLDQADARIRIVNASDADQWATVIRTAADTPSLLTCDYVDILWRVAEAFAKTDRPSRAEDAYTYILNNCNDAKERLATVQKAMALLPELDVDSLLHLARGDEFQPVEDDLIRQRVGKIAEVANGVADPGDLARLETLAADPTDATDPLLLGWYAYRRDEPAKALDWFRKGLDRDPKSAKAAEGDTLSLIALDRFAEAEGFGYDWNEASPGNLAAYLDAVTALLATDPPVKIAEFSAPAHGHGGDPREECRGRRTARLVRLQPRSGENRGALVPDRPEMEAGPRAGRLRACRRAARPP